MKLPVEWLKKYISVSHSAEKLSDLLTMSGSKVEGVQKVNGSDVIEIEVTTNRPDCLSILGLAHEISAITEKKVHYPALSKAAAKSDGSFQIKIEDKKGCPKYTARFLSNVSIKETPSEEQKLLSQVGVRTINNAVDATNFVLFEMGQPLHAFDADKLKGSQIIVRRALKNEKFLAIDGNEYTLDEDTLVIADEERAVAIAGVMGGRLTEVTSATKNILLESAYFDPALVRRASKKYKLSTDSSYRFERSVTLENVEQASRRAADLILKWGGGKETGFISKDFAAKSKPKSVSVSLCGVSRLLGLNVSAKRASTILKNLGFTVKSLGKDKISVTPPPFRRDIAREADVAEEILRIEGFDKVPAAIPTTHHSEDGVRDLKAEGMLALKQYMAALGFQEIITYSLLSKKALQQSGYQESDAHRLRNFVSAEQEFLRPSLLPGMLTAILFNLNRKAESLKLFEIGNRYVNGKEETVLSVGLCGSLEENWRRKEEASFYDLKGVIENMVHSFGGPNYHWNAGSATTLENASALTVGGEEKGSAGFVARRILSSWDIPKNVLYAEISLEKWLDRAKSAGKVKPVSKFPVVRRDIAFIIDEKIPVTRLERTLLESGSPYLKEARLFDQYQGKNIASGKRSLAFSLAYQKDTGTFTEDEITALQQIVGETLKKEFQVEFR